MSQIGSIASVQQAQATPKRSGGSRLRIWASCGVGTQLLQVRLESLEVIKLTVYSNKLYPFHRACDSCSNPCGNTELSFFRWIRQEDFVASCQYKPSGLLKYEYYEGAENHA